MKEVETVGLTRDGERASEQASMLTTSKRSGVI